MTHHGWRSRYKPLSVSTGAPEAENRRRLLKMSAPRVRRPRADLGFLVLALIVALAAPLIVKGLGLDSPQVRDAHAVNLFGNPTGPGGSHPLGVDGEGRDVLSRILYGLRSLMLISLAASALAALASAGLAGLATLHPWLRWLRDTLVVAVSSFPALLLGLALGLSLSGVWRLIVPIAVVQILSLSSPRQLAVAVGLTLSRAVAIDFGLTFLGLSPGGTTPQLGAMVARAGVGIVAGVPAWWALLFPGLVVMLVLIPGQGLTRRLVLGLAPGPPARRMAGSPVAGELTARLVQLIAVCAFAALAFKALDGSDPGGISALAAVRRGLGASGSLLLGGLVVWLAATWLHLRLATRVRRTRRRNQLAAAPAALLAASPAGWLAFLSIYAFSESVGKLPILPGAGTYIGLSHNPGRWAQSLVIPWLLLGLLPAAWTIITLNRAATRVASASQQRVARAAGVPERVLARQRRQALTAPLLASVEALLPSFVGTAVVIEASFFLPGAGAVIRDAFSQGQAATVSDMAVLVAAGIIAARLCLGVLRILADPRAARR